MRNWSSQSLPPKYRSVARRYAAIETTLKNKNLPEPCPDLSVLTAKERDLMEIYFHSIQQGRTEKSETDLTLITNVTLTKKYQNDELNIILSRRLHSDDIDAIHDISAKLTWSRKNDPRNLLKREKTPQLIAYLMDQQKLTKWLPISELNTEHLTWTAWEELLELVTEYGYDRWTDDTSNMPFISLWSDQAKDLIFHLMLEMINPANVERVWTEDMGRDLQDLTGLRHRPKW